MTIECSQNTSTIYKSAYFEQNPLSVKVISNPNDIRASDAIYCNRFGTTQRKMRDKTKNMQ